MVSLIPSPLSTSLIPAALSCNSKERKGGIGMRTKAMERVIMQFAL